MFGRILLIENDRRHLQSSRGFVVIGDTACGGQEIGRIPIDDLAAVIANAHGLSYTNNFLVALAERAIPFVLCAQNHNPVGMLLPIDGHHEQAHRIEAQISASTPAKKQLWAQIVSAKLRNQADVLAETGEAFALLVRFSERVRSGDPENLEAQGARYYWQALFGKEFLRDRKAQGVNSLLNYGYTVLRAATARAIVATGLHPSIGLHHSNDSNAMRLVDDLVEPFRPFVDHEVWRIASEQKPELDTATKKRLTQFLYQDLQTDAGISPLCQCIQRSANSLTKAFLREQKNLEFPWFSHRVTQD